MIERSNLFYPVALCTLLFVIAAFAPDLALAQSSTTSPFETGATGLQNSLTTLATPIAAILVMALGVAAAAGRISWGWPIGVVVGIGVIFAAPTVVTWTKSLFGA